MYRKLFIFVLIILISSIEALAIDEDKSREYENQKADIQSKNILPDNKQDKEVILNCVSNSSNKVKGGGNSYIFIFKDGKLFDEDNKLIKKQEITDSTFRFTYKKKQDYTRENSRFVIDRYTGHYKSYSRFSDFYASTVRREAGICKQIKNKKAF